MINTNMKAVILCSGKGNVVFHACSFEKKIESNVGTPNRSKAAEYSDQELKFDDGELA